MVKNISFTLFLLIGLFSCSKSDSFDTDPETIPESPAEESTLTMIQQYFLDVALGQEFGTGNSKLKKWTQDISIYVDHNDQDELIEELDSIILEINELSNSIQLTIVSDASEANYRIFLGPADDYKDFEPNAAPYISQNYGLFWLYRDSQSVIYRGSMYVDTERTTELSCQKHLLREEMTQSLGLMNDSFEYSESIFQQDWTCTTEYSAEDKMLIQYILNPELTANMSEEEISQYFMEN